MTKLLSNNSKDEYLLVDYNNYQGLVIVILSIVCSCFLLKTMELINVFKFLVYSIFIVIAFVDLKDMIIPDSLVVINFILVIIFYYINKRAIFINQPFKSFEILSSIWFMIIFLIIVLIIHIGYKKEIMGYGDIKLLFLMGLMIGITKLMFTLFVASFIALIIELLKKQKKSNAFPFGPYLIIGFAFINLL